MTAFRSLARAMLKGFFRDKMALFFAILFPLMFLALFGGLLGSSGTSKTEVEQVGKVTVLDDAPKEVRAYLEESLDIHRTTDEKAAIREVRKGDADAMITQRGDTLVVRFSQADQVKAATVQARSRRSCSRPTSR